MTKAAADRKVQELGIFHDVAKALTSSLDLDSILQTIMEKMAEYFRPDNWSLLMVDEERDELYFAIAVGKASEALKNVRLKVGEGIAGWVAKHGERVVVPDVYTDPRFAKRIDEMTQLGNALHHLRARCVLSCGCWASFNWSMSRMDRFHRPGIIFPAVRFVTTPPSPSKMRAPWRRSRNSPSPTIAPASTTPAISTRRWRPRSTARRGTAMNSPWCSSISTTSSRSTTPHGHLVGSKLLMEIGYPIKAQLRLIDYAFRYGGDEFVVLLPQTGKDAALIVAKRLRDSLRTSMFCQEEGLNLNVRASMGVATYPHDAKTPREIIRQADEMMYLVKNTSRDNIGIAARGVMK